MGDLMTRCPKTGKPISTGIYIERARFRSMPVFFSRSFCPRCRTSHEWFSGSAWVCDCGPVDCDSNCERRAAEDQPRARSNPMSYAAHAKCPSA